MNKPLALIVDDDRDIVALFRNVLDLAGYRTEIILHGRTAIERLATMKPDIVLLDLNLPGVSGSEVLHQIRTQPHLKNTRVVVITGHSQIAQGLEDEPDLVLFKPVNIDQLTSLVQRLHPTGPVISEPPLDAGTGFYNLSFFKSRLDYSLARLKQLDLSHFTVLLVDINRFEGIAGQLGESASRRFLREISNRLKGVLRPTDTIAHFNGGRFAILIEEVKHWDIPILLANRILTRLGSYLDEKGIPSQVNIGIILCHIGYANVDDILRDAEASLALAKAERKSGYKFYAQDNFNNVYDLDMIADMISLAGAAPLNDQPMGQRTGIRVRQLEVTQPKFHLLV